MPHPSTDRPSNPTLPTGAAARKPKQTRVVDIATNNHRQRVEMIDSAKSQLICAFQRGISERNIASMFGMRREQVELVIFEKLTEKRAA